MPKLTLSDGAVIEGSPDQLLKYAKALGIHYVPVGVYRSESRGWVEISVMDTVHIKNAMLKKYAQWATTLRGLNDSELVSALQNGPSDREFLDLYKEFVRRTTGR